MTDTILTTPDGIRLHTVSWLPAGDPRAAVLLVHGIAEHSGRYAHVAAHLNAQGYAVYSFDHRAHGQSSGEPRSFIADFDLPVADTRLVFEALQAQQPGKKLFIYGHSMGSFVTLLFAMRYQAELAGVISSGCPLTIDTTVPAAVVMIGNILNSILPMLPLVKLELAAISRDPAVVTAYNNDPLVVQTPVRVRMATSYNQALKALRPALGQLRVPLLLLHGEADRIAPVSGSQLVYDQAGAGDKTLKRYPGLYHEIHNEPEKAQVLADITDWLNAHTA